MKPKRCCRLPSCGKLFEDPGPGKRVAPTGYCSAICAATAARERANRKASMRAVPPRAPLRLLSPSSRDWKEPHAKRDAEGVCRVCGRRPISAAHVIPRAMVANGAEDKRNIVPLCEAEPIGCHALYDGGQLDLLPYLTPEEQAYAALIAGGLVAALRVVSGGRESAA